MHMKHTLSILVENHAGVLSRISGLFARRGFNIDSLAVGITDDPAISRITIVVNGDNYIIEQVEKQLNKLIDVIRLRKLEPEQNISRELVLIKVESTPETIDEILSIAKDMRGEICDRSDAALTIELSAEGDTIDVLCERLKPYNILELVRTGTIALEKGAGKISV